MKSSLTHHLFGFKDQILDKQILWAFKGEHTRKTPETPLHNLCSLQIWYDIITNKISCDATKFLIQFAIDNCTNNLFCRSSCTAGYY